MISEQQEKEAADLWTQKRFLEAGETIFESLPPEIRPRWATEVLKEFSPEFPAYSPIETLLGVGIEPHRWGEAEALFDEIRALTLLTGEPRLAGYFSLAENVAKVVFNATVPRAPFDQNSGWRIARDVALLADRTGLLSPKQAFDLLLRAVPL